MFRYIDHSGDIGLEVRASSVDELFAEAARGFVDTVSNPAGLRTGDVVTVDLASPGLDLLLVDWLSELLFRFDTDGFLPASTDVAVTRDAGTWRLHATARGESRAAGRVPVKLLVKGITYHHLGVERTPGGWQARVVLDV